MESQPQNPEFRINPENFQSNAYLFIHVGGLYCKHGPEQSDVGTQKNHLNATQYIIISLSEF